MVRCCCEPTIYKTNNIKPWKMEIDNYQLLSTAVLLFCCRPVLLQGLRHLECVYVYMYVCMYVCCAVAGRCCYKALVIWNV